VAGLVVGEVCNTSELEGAGGVHVGVRGGGVDQATALPPPTSCASHSPVATCRRRDPSCPQERAHFFFQFLKGLAPASTSPAPTRTSIMPPTLSPPARQPSTTGHPSCNRRWRTGSRLSSKAVRTGGAQREAPCGPPGAPTAEPPGPWPPLVAPPILEVVAMLSLTPAPAPAPALAPTPSAAASAVRDMHSL
jgi:hypothetical protein